MRKWIWKTLVRISVIVACAAVAIAQTPETGPASQPARASEQDAWNRVLSTRVDDAGRVDYAGLVASPEDRAVLQARLAELAAAEPEEWAPDEQMSFWINAYNALVISGLVERWPVSSPLEVPGFFDQIEHTVASQSLTLNDIENQKLREAFRDPRIHCAVNCAAASCPPLRTEVFEASRLDAQLDEQCGRWVRETTRVDEAEGAIHVSKLFEWYTGDFDARGGIRGFIREYIEPTRQAAVARDDYAIVFDEYDWTVNSQ